jgi:hypothetical protein
MLMAAAFENVVVVVTERLTVTLKLVVVLLGPSFTVIVIVATRSGLSMVWPLSCG